MTIFTSNFQLDLTPSVNEFFWTDKTPWISIYDKFFDVNKTTERFKRYVLGVGLGIGAVKEEGAGGTYDDSQQGWNMLVEQVTYSLGFKISEEAMEDGHVLDLAEINSRQCKNGMRVAKEIVHSQILNYLTDSGHLGGDGVVGLSTAHPTFSGSTYANTLSSQPILSEASLESLLILNRTMIDERGIPMQAIREVAMMYHPSNRFNAVRALKGTERPGTADREISAMNKLGQLQMEAIENPYLTDVNTVVIKNDVEDGLISLTKRELRLQSQNVQNTTVAEFLATERYIAEKVNPRGFIGLQL